jgi:hypothetical protein
MGKEPILDAASDAKKLNELSKGQALEKAIPNAVKSRAISRSEAVEKGLIKDQSEKTFRDDIAIAAMTSLVNSGVYNVNAETPDTLNQKIAEVSYNIADAMLKAREPAEDKAEPHETVDIFINAEPYTVPYGDGSLSYEEIRSILKFPDASFPTCTWRLSLGSGILSPGKSVMLDDGLKITMMDTSNA